MSVVNSQTIHSLHHIEICIEIYHFHIVHNNLVYSPLFVLFCIAIVSSFSWVLQVSQGKLKTRAWVKNLFGKQGYYLGSVNTVD